ncbi:MAG: efflux RND transporter periplasmic adaptor subunit [Alphaproteobacteria bacterium]|nr:efflux RND transporter periplasmic adaptor subunit [Alphaproteobacteria bacterium]
MGGLKRKALFLPPVLIGIAVLLWFARSGDAPVRIAPDEAVRPARVISVPAVDFVPRTLGYGHIQPGRVWEAVAEVGGRIVEKHPRLESGELLAAGEVILRIDPTDYELAVESARARIRGAEAQIAELDVRAENTRRSLEIEQRGLALAETDLTRRQTLLKRGSISQATVDEAERTVLSLRQAVQGQRSALALIPAEREVLAANLALFESELRQAERNLERTELVTPFDGRVAAVNVEERQFAASGQVLAVLDGVDLAEVAAQIPLDRMRQLVAGTPIDVQDTSPENLGEVFGRLGLTAVVRLSAGELQVSWPARFVRIRESVDPSTRTAGVVVAVDEPYKFVEVGRRPPLAKNMFVEVELQGRPVPGRLVVPRAALHDGMVYVVGDGSRLERRPVQVGAHQSGFVIVDSGLAAGEIIVVTDLTPAIDGMLVDPVEDTALRDRLIAAATGQGAIR